MFIRVTGPQTLENVCPLAPSGTPDVPLSYDTMDPQAMQITGPEERLVIDPIVQESVMHNARVRLTTSNRLVLKRIVILTVYSIGIDQHPRPHVFTSRCLRRNTATRIPARLGFLSCRSAARICTRGCWPSAREAWTLLSKSCWGAVDGRVAGRIEQLCPHLDVTLQSCRCLKRGTVGTGISSIASCHHCRMDAFLSEATQLYALDGTSEKSHQETDHDLGREAVAKVPSGG